MTTGSELPADEILDRARLVEASGGIEGFAEELVSLFLDDAGPRLAAMRAAAEGGNPEGVWREAHTLKGSAATIGAARASETSRILEMAARSGDLSNARALIADLAGELEQVAKALEGGL